MEVYHEDGIIPSHGNGIIAWKWNYSMVSRTYCIQPKNNDVIIVDDYLCPINATVLTVA